MFRNFYMNVIESLCNFLVRERFNTKKKDSFEFYTGVIEKYQRINL